MANCLDFNNASLIKTRDTLATMIDNHIKISDSTAVAEMILERNNGNDINKNPNGTNSPLFIELIDNLGFDRAFLTRLNMFTDDFINKVGDWTKTGVEPTLIDVLPTVHDRSSGGTPFYINDAVSSIDLQKSELNDENEDMLKCLGYAKDGIRKDVHKGGKWVVRDRIIGPSHEQGGVDINVRGNYMNIGGTPVKAEEGLYFNQSGLSSYAKDQSSIDANQYVIDPVQTESDRSLETLITNYTNDIKSINNAKVKLLEQRAIEEEEAKIEKEKPIEEKVVESKVENTVLSTTDYNTRYEGTGQMNTTGVDCDNSMCSAFVQEELYDNVNPNLSFQEFRENYGIQGDAWEMVDNIVDKGGSIIKNGYTKGDILEINNPNSKYISEANRDGSGSTHIGIYDEIDGNIGYVIHNWGGKMYRTPVNLETGKFLDDKFNNLTPGRTVRKK